MIGDIITIVLIISLLILGILVFFSSVAFDVANDVMQWIEERR